MAWRYARQTRRPVCTALRLIACSETVANISYIVGASLSVQLTWWGHPFPGWVPYWAKTIATLADIGILIGACLPGVAGAIATIGRARARHHAYRDLEPLWTALTSAFPESTLHRAPNIGVTDWLAWVSPNRRYYRRTVECRDGLVQISPYLPHDVGHDPPAQARALQSALRSRQARASPTGNVRLLAMPTQPHGDGDALPALSRALAEVESIAVTDLSKTNQGA